MHFSRRRLLYFFSIIVVVLFLATFQLPYYIYKPGGADELTPIVEVEDGFKSKGDMHLVTVSGGQATIADYLWAKVLPHHEILELEEVRPKGISDDEYMHAQLQMMEGSQKSSVVVAYEAAKAEVLIEFNGVYVVSVIEDMPADGKLQMGDRIIGIDGEEIKEADDLIDYIDRKEAGDNIHIKVNREEKDISVDLTLESFEDLDNKVGMGIQLVTDRTVTVNPDVHFTSGNIGGPSAGLMFALEIYDQLTEKDLTKGYQVIGTGEVDFDGNIGRIGGIDKKVVAAERAGCDIFFAPNENGAEDSNYRLAKKTATDIKSKMKIIPVDTFDEALEYLQTVEPKEAN